MKIPNIKKFFKKSEAQVSPKAPDPANRTYVRKDPIEYMPMTPQPKPEPQTKAKPKAVEAPVEKPVERNRAPSVPFQKKLATVRKAIRDDPSVKISVSALEKYGISSRGQAARIISFLVDDGLLTREPSGRVKVTAQSK